MARSFIGIDVAGNLLRAAVLEERSGTLETTALIKRELDHADNAAEIVLDLLQERDLTNARLAMALPASHTLTRQLEFPFGDRRKIDAAVPFELNSQLPIDLEDHLVTALPARRRGDKFNTTGLAVPTGQINSALKPFDERQLPLRYLGLVPFTFAGQFTQQPDTCVLLAVREEEISALLLLDRVPMGCRLNRRAINETAADAAGRIYRDVMALQKTAGRSDLPILAFGSGLDEEFRQALVDAMPQTTLPEERFDGEQLPSEFLPALALARRAAGPEQEDNLRRGPFAFRGSLAPFRKQLIAATVLLVTILATVIGGAWISYTRQAALADKLQQQMEDIYLQTFSGTDKPPKDIPLHMTSRLNAARDQSRLLGGPAVAPLPALEAVSRAFSEESRSVVREFTYEDSGLRLSGQAESFDAVDQLAARLSGEPVFSSARISDAKTSIDGKLVDFRIDLGFVGKEGSP